MKTRNKARWYYRHWQQRRFGNFIPKSIPDEFVSKTKNGNLSSSNANRANSGPWSYARATKVHPAPAKVPLNCQNQNRHVKRSEEKIGTKIAKSKGSCKFSTLFLWKLLEMDILKLVRNKLLNSNYSCCRDRGTVFSLNLVLWRH